MDCPSLLSSNSFKINIGNRLVLYNGIFPYPPFQDYEVRIDQPWMVEEYRVNTTPEMLEREGATSRYSHYYTFPTPGIVVLTITKTRDNTRHVVIVRVS